MRRRDQDRRHLLAEVKYTVPEIVRLSDSTERRVRRLIETGVVAPDVGANRKRFSWHEAAMAIMAAKFLRAGVSPECLVGPFTDIRDQFACEPVSFERFCVALAGQDRFWFVLSFDSKGGATGCAYGSEGRPISPVELRVAAYPVNGSDTPFIYMADGHHPAVSREVFKRHEAAHMRRLDRAS